MTKTRLEAFTDAVIAIIMTILILGLEPPKAATFAALWELRYSFLVYILSFVSLAIYWNNHHHLFQIAKVINGRVLWANFLFIFFLSLIPFVTQWVDGNLFELAPEVTYGVVLMMADISYAILLHELKKANGPDSKIARAHDGYMKLRLTLSINTVGILIGIFAPISILIFYIIGLIPWIIPEKRIEKILREEQE